MLGSLGIRVEETMRPNVAGGDVGSGHALGQKSAYQAVGHVSRADEGDSVAVQRVTQKVSPIGLPCRLFCGIRGLF